MKMTTDLYNAPSETILQITDFKTGIMAKRRLLSLGLHNGDEIEKTSNYRHGPVLIKIKREFQNQVAIGKGLASKIFVSYEAG